MDKPRNPECENRIFSDDKGNKFQGTMFLTIPDFNQPLSFLNIELYFKDGKIDGERAIIYPDGYEETWENGKFVKVNEPPWSQEPDLEFIERLKKEMRSYIENLNKETVPDKP